MKNPDHISVSLKNNFFELKYFDVDPGWRKFGSGIPIIQGVDLFFLLQVSVSDPWCLSRFLRYFFPSLISDPEFNNNKKDKGSATMLLQVWIQDSGSGSER